MTSEIQRKQISIWREIAEAIQEKGYSKVAASSVGVKFRYLKRTFQTILDNRTKTGRGRINWKYFDLFLSIFHDD